MQRAFRETVVVQPGGRIEVQCPELADGTPVDVIVVQTRDAPVAPPRKFSHYFGKAQGSFSHGDEADAFLRAERDRWSP